MKGLHGRLNSKFKVLEGKLREIDLLFKSCKDRKKSTNGAWACGLIAEC